jgi:DNA-binding MarR family transcriptional regulator/GNAT superfamily N-acetyltransferase
VATHQIAAVRAFSRFYTRRLGVLQEGMPGSPFSLAEARVIDELARGGNRRSNAAHLARTLELDPGYLSRILKGFERRGLIRREVSEADGRRSELSLTGTGEQAFAAMEGSSAEQIRDLLEPLAPEQRARLTGAMADLRRLLGDDELPQPAAVIRPHRPGDLGWVVQRHAELYTREYGWDGSFEAVVAEIAAQFIKDFDPAWEQCWIAELDGQRVGSVCLVRRGPGLAKLRLLLLDPQARGLGLGRRLVDECLGFARDRGYRAMELWTMSNLIAARHIYERAGFTLRDQQPTHSFGKDLVEETWRIEL